MALNVEQMRAEVAKLYNGDGWRKKVAAMSDAQVIAIYHKRIA